MSFNVQANASANKVQIKSDVYLLHICKILYLDNLLMISLYTILISLSYAVITVVNRTLSSVSVGFVAARGLMRSARLCRTANVIV